MSFDWLKGGVTLTGASDQDFEVAGIDLGPTLDGFAVGTPSNCHGVHSNFALGMLELAGPGIVQFNNRFDNNPNDPSPAEALYVRNLILRNGSKFTIADNAYVYYVGLAGSIGNSCIAGCDRIQSVPCPGGPDACLPLTEDCPLITCISGPGVTANNGCQVHDRDGDVDLFDVALAETLAR